MDTFPRQEFNPFPAMIPRERNNNDEEEESFYKVPRNLNIEYLKETQSTSSESGCSGNKIIVSWSLVASILSCIYNI